jgi:hypothetical protein
VILILTFFCCYRLCEAKSSAKTSIAIDDCILVDARGDTCFVCYLQYSRVWDRYRIGILCQVYIISHAYVRVISFPRDYAIMNLSVSGHAGHVIT